MKDFNFIAKTKDGETQKGKVEAEDESAAAAVLIKRDLFPIRLSTQEEGWLKFLNKVRNKDKVFFMRQLATIINAGLPIAQALRTLEEQTSNKNLKSLISQVGKNVDGGMSLSASLAGFPKTFSQIDITLIQSGETSGSIDKALARLAANLENDFKIKKKVRGAFIYPGFIMLVLTGVMVLMMVYVLPQMQGLYDSFGAQLPAMTRVIMGISNFITKYWYLVLLVLIAASFGLRAYIRTPAGRRNWDKAKISIPIFKDFMIKIYLSRFTRTLSGLVATGVDILESIDIVSRSVSNKILESILLKIEDKVKSGTALSVAIKEHPEFPALVHQMIRVGEESGEMDTMLSNLADYYENEVDNVVKNMTTILEPILLVVMGLGVGILLIGIMLPIYSLGKVIK